MAAPTPTTGVLSSVLTTPGTRLTTITSSQVITATAGEVITSIISIPATAAPSKAVPQSVLESGYPSPNTFSASDPIKLFIIQIFIILVICRLLAVVLAKLRQPRVISEVITGLLLGPSVFGRIPGFTNAIFPTASIANLTLVANIGLVFFLFLVGVEADLSVFKKNGKPAAAISIVGLVFPFGMGCAVSVGIYHKFADTSKVDFGVFLLFIGTAMAITAFPVLARILTELKMLGNSVGLTVLAAGVGNDVVGWILLALSVALANAAGGVTTVYILLCGVGIVLLLFFIVRPIYRYLVRKSGSLEHGPTAGIMFLTFIIVLSAAFVTDIIGIHPIFGAFLVGILVVPRHHGFANALTEKIEDFVSILFIPIYFVLSGLSTDLGLLNNGSIWGYTVCVIIVAFVSKFASCGAMAKLFGFSIRESLAVGSLMACKGLVELIVLNVGLQAGILNGEVFAMFVVMALVTTFAATPLTLWFYPESYWRPKLQAGHEGSWRPVSEDGSKPTGPGARNEQYFRRRFVVVLERLESLAPIMSFVRLLQPASVAGDTPTSPVTRIQPNTIDAVGSITESESAKSVDENEAFPKLDRTKSSVPASTVVETISTPTISVNAHRLLALTERTSSLFQASVEEATKRADSILNIFSAFSNLASIPFTTSMSIVPQEDFADRVTSQAADTNADLLVIPWAAGISLSSPEDEDHSTTRLESLFSNAAFERSPQYASFVRRVFMESTLDVALFLDAGVSAADPARTYTGAHRHIYMPFHGGPDDRAALDFVMQLVASNPDMTATVARFVRTAPDANDPTSIDSASSAEKPHGESSVSSPLGALNQFTIGAGSGVQDTVYTGAQNTHHRLASDTADNIALSKYFPSAMIEKPESADPPLLAEALNRVKFQVVSTPTPMMSSILVLQTLTTRSRSLLVALGRSRHSAPSHRIELESYLKEKISTSPHSLQGLGIAASSDVRKTLGDLGSAIVVSGEADSLLILQSAIKSEAFVKGKKAKGV